MPTLTLVRHTSVGVPGGICYGQTDVPLADTYEVEWQDAIDRLGDLSRFTRVYSSPLTRCLSFAQRYFGEVETDGRLMELDFGAFEGLSWEEIFLRDEGKRWFSDYLHTSTPGGESYDEMTERVRLFYEEKIAKSGEEEEILLVTHSGVLRAFLILLKGLTPEEAMEEKIGYGEVLFFVI